MTSMARTAVAAAAALLAVAGGACRSHSEQEPVNPLASWPPAARAAAPRGGARTAVGWIVRAGADEIVVRRGTGGDLPDLRLLVTPSIAATEGGRERPAAELHEGTRVRAAYDMSGGLAHATAIEITQLATGQ